MDCIYLIVLLIGLAIIGGIIDMIVPGKMPYGLLGGIGAAIVGGMIGGWIFKDFGPGIPVPFSSDLRFYWIPGILGGIILGFIVRFLMGMSGRKTL